MIISKFIQVAANGIISFLWLTFQCVCVCVNTHTSYLYPFIFWWTFRLLPHLGYCKCCSEHWGAYIFSSEFPPDICPGVGFAGSYSNFIFSFVRDCKEIQPVHPKGDQSCSLEGLMLKLKLQYFGHHMQRVDSLEKTLMLRGIGDRRRRDDRGWDGWMASPTQRTWVCVSSRSWCWTGIPGVLWFMGSQRVRYD